MIRPANLRQDWPRVSLLLERCIAKTDEPWWPEDVYASVANGKSAMWVSDDPAGVLVAYPDREEWTQDMVLHVWIVACDDMAALEHEAYTVLAEAARKIGAKKLVMDSPRTGWQRNGWAVRRYTYERSL